MPQERVRISPQAALKMVQNVHRRPGHPLRREVVLGIARQMLAADENRETWQQGMLRPIILSEEQVGRPAGVILGVEVLLAVVYTGRSRSLLVTANAPLRPYLDEVEPTTGPAVGENGTELISKMTVDTWVEDPGA